MRGEGNEFYKNAFFNVADFAIDLDPSAIPAGAMERASLMLLDKLGVCAAAASMEAGELARNAATLLYSSAEAEYRANMLFDNRVVSLTGAAYVAATQIDNLDGHDGYNIGLEQISGPGLSDPKVAAFVGRTLMEASERHQARFPVGRWADVEITLADGRVLVSGDTHARGGPERPVDPNQVVEKYLHFAAPALGEARARGICDAVLALTEPESRFDAVARSLYGPV